MDQTRLASRQFGNTARNYLTSPVHAHGEDLALLASLVAGLCPARALDVGCGAGHASFAMASGGASEVVAYDLSGPMLSVVEKEARVRAPGQITTQQGSAEKLPFADRSFDLVTTRFSAHHWFDIQEAVAEMARVVVPGGTLVVIDVVAPETPLYDTVLQTVEFLRDLSHARNYRMSEWDKMISKSGFALSGCNLWKLPIDFESWVARIGTVPDRVKALHAVFADLPEEARNYFGVGEDHSFQIDSAWIHAVRTA